MTATALAPLRHLLKDTDLTVDVLDGLLESSAELKRLRRTGARDALAGRVVAVLFEKPSTRTRSAFEVAAHELGAHSTYIDPASSHLGVAESVEDTARVLGRYYDGIAFRGFAQESVETLAAHAGVPVWNALTDTWHPTQALADLLTIREHAPQGRRAAVCFVGRARCRLPLRGRMGQHGRAARELGRAHPPASPVSSRSRDDRSHRERRRPVPALPPRHP